MPATPAVYAATPQIAIEGEASGLLSASLDDLVVRETTDGLVTCEARFQNVGGQGGEPDFQFFDRALLDFGAVLEITAGAGDRSGVVFSGYITGLRAEYPQRGGAVLAVLAEDRLQDLRMTRRTRTFEDMSDAQAFEQVASGQGLQPDILLSGPTHRVIAQIDQSDLAFVRQRAHRVGAEVWVDGDTLHVAQRSDRRGTAVTLSHRQNLREASLDADLANQRTTFAIGGWDPSTKEAIDVAADVSALASERLGGGTAGVELLEQAFGARPERMIHAVPFSTEEAQDLADGHFRAMARRFVTGEVVAEGDARIRVGGRVELVGVGPWFAGTYDVVEVRHLFDLATGYRTNAHIERAELML